MGALKSALTAIFNANNYTSSTSGIASKKIPVNESNGLPSGQIGMSDLASVLGGTTRHVFISDNGAGLEEKDVAKWICQNYPDKSLFTFDGGWSSTSTRGMFKLFIGNTSDLDSNGYPKYACGYFIRYVSGANPYFKAINIYNGTVTEKYVAFQ